AYVSVGDSTILMAGKKGTIMNLGQDEPLNFLGLFNAAKVDNGVKWSVRGAENANDNLGDGGHVIQVVSDLGNGVSVGVGLENLNEGAFDDATTAAVDEEAVARSQAGTAVGVVSYAGDGIAAHVTVAAGGILDGVVESWG